MVAWLVRQMHRYSHPHLSREELADHVHRRFLCAYLATENSGPLTRAAARAVAEEVGARFHDGNVQPALSAAHAVVESMTGEPLSWRNPEHDVTLQNIQARVRGMLIWTLANLEGALLLVTSNKSEAAVGYTTMDGDSSGGLAPISDVPKSLIKLYLDWAADFHGLKSLQMIKGMEATAELRPQGSGQTDETDLMPFHVLDQLMYAFVQLALDPREILIRYWPVFREHYRDDVREFAAAIRKFVRLFCFAQWKRERIAISFRVTAFDLDPKTGFRFPPVQAPFTEELADMDRHVEEILRGRATLDAHPEP